MTEITRDNLRVLLASFMEKDGLTIDNISKSLGCQKGTLGRILAGITLPSDECMKQVGTMIDLGYPTYSKLTKAQKRDISDTLGIIAGGTLGFASITTAISSAGVVAGVSAAGITSGLAALGAVVGGGMLAGIAVAAAIPIATGTLGYLTVKGVKLAIGKSRLSEEGIDPVWEIHR